MRRKSATTAAVSVAPLFGEIRHGYAAHVSAFPMSSPSRGDRGCLPERPGRDGGCRGDPGIRGGSPPREAGAAPGALLPPCPARRGGGGAAAGSWRRREGGRETLGEVPLFRFLSQATRILDSLHLRSFHYHSNFIFH